MSEPSTAIESVSLGSKLGADSADLRIAGEKTSALAQLNERLSEWCSSILE